MEEIKTVLGPVQYEPRREDDTSGRGLASAFKVSGQNRKQRRIMAANVRRAQRKQK